MSNLLLQLANPRTLMVFKIWGEIKHYPIDDIDDCKFMDIMDKLAIPETKQGFALQVFQQIRKVMMAADIDTWADSITDEGLYKFFIVFMDVMSNCNRMSPSEPPRSGTGVLCELGVDNNNNNKDNNNNKFGDFNPAVDSL